MYDILTSNAQSVLSNEGVQTNNAGVVKFTSDNEGCVEFIDNSKTYRLNFTKNGNEFDLSSEVEIIENIKSMTDANENVDATTSNDTEEGTEEVSKTTELEEKMAEIETKMGSMMTDIDELKAYMPNQKTDDVETTTTVEATTEEVENTKTAKPYYGDYAEYIINNEKTFI